MRGEIITIGNELISGIKPDMNSRYAVKRLSAEGFDIHRVTSVGDDYEMVSKALQHAISDASFVVITGGLGSTDDDITNEIVAKVLRRPLYLDSLILGKIKRYVDEHGLRMTPSLEKMARVPQGSRILTSENFCGCCIVERNVRIYFLPGVPEQMHYLLDTIVIPELCDIFRKRPVLKQRVLRIYGLSEPDIAEMLNDYTCESYGVDLGFYPEFPENKITVSCRGKDETEVKSELDRIESDLRAILGEHVFGTDSQDMEIIVGEALARKKMTISVAESCTGGMIGHKITNVPGSSAYFLGGMVVYSNESKTRLLGVDSKTLETHGAVSDNTVRKMAEGIKIKMNSDLGLAVTGIAGPEGGSPTKPVGTVYIGMAVENMIFSRKYRFWGNREQIRKNTSMMALDWIRRYLNGNTFIPGI